MVYKREIKRQLRLRQLLFILLLAGAIVLVVTENYVYFPFIAVTFLILDIIFPIYELTITDNTLIAKRLFAGGILKRHYTVTKASIREVVNIDTGNTTDSFLDIEYGVFAPISSDNFTKQYEQYRIRYYNEVGMYKTIRLPLLQTEAKRLAQALLPTT